MASSPHNSASDKVKPWPAYFIVRTSGEVVPLIGVDELPVGTDLIGVPRALDLEDTIGMLNLGIQRSSEAFYRIVRHEEEEEEEEEVVTDDIAKSKATKPIVAQSKAADSAKQTLHNSPARSTATPSSSSSNTTRRTTASHRYPEVQACRHWCTYGHCKWGQQCRYRHRMPKTLSGLREIGLNDWPAWFRSSNPGYFANESMHSKPSSVRRGKGRNCDGGIGCCGDGCRGGLNLSASHVKAERMRAAGKAVSERQKEEEVAERVMEKLRAPARKELERKAGQVEKEKLIGGSVKLERASIKDAKDWEDDGSETSEEEKGKVFKKASGGKTSLLD